MNLYSEVVQGLTLEECLTTLFMLKQRSVSIIANANEPKQSALLLSELLRIQDEIETIEQELPRNLLQEIVINASWYVAVKDSNDSVIFRHESELPEIDFNLNEVAPFTDMLEFEALKGITVRDVLIDLYDSSQEKEPDSYTLIILSNLLPANFREVLTINGIHLEASRSNYGEICFKPLLS